LQNKELDCPQIPKHLSPHCEFLEWAASYDEETGQYLFDFRDDIDQ
jgi:hypothetical protein